MYIANYRTGVIQGSIVDGSLLSCEVKRLPTYYTQAIPTVLWTLNGKLIANSTQSAFIMISSLEIVNFNLSDAGVYQCIFTDTDADSEVVTSTPFRVDTGTTAVLITELGYYCVHNSLSVHNVSIGLTCSHHGALPDDH